MSSTRKKGVNSTTCEYNIRKITMAHESSCAVREKKQWRLKKTGKRRTTKNPSTCYLLPIEGYLAYLNH